MFRDLDPEVMKEANAIMNAQGWCASLAVRPDTQEFVKALRQLCKGGVYAVTSPMHSYFWHKERDEWLDKHYSIDRDHVIHASAKYKVEGDFFLDDKPKHVQKWNKKWVKGRGMLWSTDHNQRLGGYEDIRVHSFDEGLGHRAEGQAVAARPCIIFRGRFRPPRCMTIAWMSTTR